MKKIELLREQVQRVRALLVLMPGSARDAIALTLAVLEEQQAQIDQLTLQVNRLTERTGDV